ncbi:MAG: hypothetical protein JNL62_22605 [Bryobacterales bacterium]|nr:hypothetical protein [Bryobacterales bacterium]
MNTTRRAWMQAAAAAPMLAADASPFDLETTAVRNHDKGVENLLRIQITESGHPHRGSWPDAFGIHYPASPAASSDTFTAAFLHSKSKFHKSPLMLERMKLGIDYAVSTMTPDGNIHLPFTNFNSPPDTAFAVWGAGNAACLAKKHGSREILQILDPFLTRAKRGLLKGGMHTPNHRWVACSAMALLNEANPDPAFLKRIDQWLAEGIDIDEDGQYDERSIIGYNVIVDRSLVIMADKLKRPELLEPLRKNLDAAFYLMHPGDEMVTEISHRQDRNAIGNIGVYWFPMHYMATRDNNPRYAWVAQKYAPTHAALSMLMSYPNMLKPLPAPEAPPENYAKEFKALEIVRIRRGHKSATIMLRGDSRFLMLRSGDAVVGALRFASAFFGKAQFIPRTWSKSGNSYVLKHELTGPYYQPLNPPHRVKAGEWNETRPERQRTEVCHLEQMATVTETEKGFRVRIQAHGTDNVPLAIEISARDKDQLNVGQLAAAPQAPGAWILGKGTGSIKSAKHEVRFGLGVEAHQYTQVRGAEPMMPGHSVYLTGFTPFDHTIEFECL